MRTLLITLLVSTVVTAAFWQFGLANLVWPAHPFLATLGIAVTCGIRRQLLLPKISSPSLVSDVPVKGPLFAALYPEPHELSFAVY